MRTFVDFTNAGGAAFLASRAPCWMAELFTVTISSGTVYRWNSSDIDLKLAGNTWFRAWPGVAPLITRNRFGVKNTVEVPELELRLGCDDTLLGNLKAQIHNGLFDGATVEMSRVYMPAPGDTKYGRTVLFSGRLSGVTIDAEGITVTSKGHNVLMNQQAPRNLYQTNCEHTFCDAGCTLAESLYTFTGQTVGGGSSARGLVWTVPAGFTAGQFTLGKVTMTSGPASGQIRTVALAAGVSMVFTYPLYDAPNPDDTFSILMGCDRQLASCKTRKQANGTSIDNSQHYRGFPFVPPAELAV
ncbi:MAG TPA: DUF2163 domain-containing protein [Rhizomicrobium sp.]|jgi:uncharacterized phage protein (TIGR02218 family)|nr:DUF2163 domain-containing protein [Rhizomicrobium sp.]